MPLHVPLGAVSRCACYRSYRVIGAAPLCKNASLSHLGGTETAQLVGWLQLRRRRLPIVGDVWEWSERMRT